MCSRHFRLPSKKRRSAERSVPVQSIRRRFELLRDHAALEGRLRFWHLNRRIVIPSPPRSNALVAVGEGDDRRNAFGGSTFFRGMAQRVQHVFRSMEALWRAILFHLLFDGLTNSCSPIAAEQAFSVARWSDMTGLQPDNWSSRGLLSNPRRYKNGTN